MRRLISAVICAFSMFAMLNHPARACDEIRVRDFGAVGDGIADDTAAIQSAYDACASMTTQSRTVCFDGGRVYKTTATIIVKAHWTRSAGNGATIRATGPGPAIDAQPVSGVYPVRCAFSRLAIEVWAPATAGVRWRFSHSVMADCAISLKAADQTGVDLAGDPAGTGPYYCTFQDVAVQGMSLTGQRGWDFSYDPTSPTRCPNANVVIHGRVGQVAYGWRVRGSKNLLVAPVLEGVTVTGIEFDHPNSGIGCIENAARDAYVEGAAGLTAFLIGPRSIESIVQDPRITSIGTAGVQITDAGSDTHVLSTNRVFLQAWGRPAVFRGPGAPTLAAASGSIYLRSDGVPSLYVREGAGWVAK